MNIVYRHLLVDAVRTQAVKLEAIFIDDVVDVIPIPGIYPAELAFEISQ